MFIKNGFAISAPSYLKPVKLAVPAFLTRSYFSSSIDFMSKSKATSAFKIPVNGLSNFNGYAFSTLAKLITPLAFALISGLVVIFLTFAEALKASLSIVNDSLFKSTYVSSSNPV